jgi:hypothetical protein
MLDPKTGDARDSEFHHFGESPSLFWCALNDFSSAQRRRVSIVADEFPRKDSGSHDGGDSLLRPPSFGPKLAISSATPFVCAASLDRHYVANGP